MDKIKEPAPTTRTGESAIISDNPTKNIAQNIGKVKDFWHFYDDTRYENLEEPTVFDGWVVEGGINVLYSDAGKGKSYLLTSMCLKIAKQHKDISVFYIDLDNPVVLPKARNLPAIVRNLGITNFYYINSLFFEDIDKELTKRNMSYKDTKNKLIKFTKLLLDTVPGKVVVVFDSLQNFVNTNEIKEVDTALDFMKQHTDKFTYLFIHHINKVGQFKGLTTIRDKADSFYSIGNVEKEVNGYIQSQIIKADKRRFLTEETITYRYIDIFMYELIDFSVSKEDEIVLRIAVNALRAGKQKQKDLIDAISNKVNIGRNKIFATLKEFEGRLFTVEIGEKNTKFYALNEKSEILNILRKDLSPTKQSLLDTIRTLEIAYGELSDPIEIELAGKVVEYRTFAGIKRDIYKLKPDDVEIILETLSKRYQD